MTSRVAWGVGVALLVAGAAMLLWAVKGGGGGSGDDDGPAGARAARNPTAGGDLERRPPPRKADGGDAPAPRGGGDGGTSVRDHRSDPRPIVTGSPPPHSGTPERKVEPVTTAAVRMALRPHVERCKAAVDPATLGADPYLQVVVRVHISGGKLGVDDTEVQLRDVDDGALADCIRDATAGLAVAAGGHPDVDQATLTHGFKLR